MASINTDATKKEQTNQAIQKMFDEAEFYLKLTDNISVLCQRYGLFWPPLLKQLSLLVAYRCYNP